MTDAIEGPRPGSLPVRRGWHGSGRSAGASWRSWPSRSCFMAFVTGVVLAVAFWQPAIIAIAIAAGVFVIRENVAELARGR